MARTKIVSDMDMTHAPQYATAASVESGLADFLAQLSSSCGGVFTLTCARAAERQAQAALEALSKKRKKAGAELTGLIATTTNAVTQKRETVPVTVEMLQTWVDSYAPLAAAFQSVAVILATLIKIGTQNTSILNSRAVVRADVMTASTMALHAPTTKYTYETFPLLTRYRCRCVTEADRDFLYKYLRQNGPEGHEVLYWMTDGGAVVIPREEKYGTIPQGDREFWEIFNSTNDQKMEQILHAIERVAYTYEQEKPVGDDGMPEISFEDRLLTFVPQCLLRYAVLTRRMRTEQGENGTPIQKFDCYMVECSLGQTDHGGNREKWREALSKALLYEIALGEVRHAPQFSNVPGEGLSCIPLAGELADGTTWCVDKLGMQGRLRAERGEGAPPLPSEFHDFFFGKNDSFSFFESDPRMSLLRIADFLYRVMIDGTSCRQCLTLAGSGKDGKSIFIKVIFGILGLAETTLDATKLEDPAHRYAILNSPLVVMPEVSKASTVFSSGFFKSITGGDSVQLKKLYYMPIDWRPEHTRFMITTNNPVSVGGDAQISRLLPIACQRAYDARTARAESEIIASCLTQRVPFMQWVCDTVAYYKALKTPSGEPLGLFLPDQLHIITDADFDDVMRGELALLDMSKRDMACLERRAIEATGSNRFYVRFGEDASDDEAEWYEALFNALFEQADDCVSRADVAKALMSALEISPITKQARSLEAKFAADALGIKTAHILWDKSFKAFKEWLVTDGKIKLVKLHGTYVYRGMRVKPLDDAATISPDMF